MDIEAMQQVFAQSEAGKLTFPEVVRRALDAGVESYFCDLTSGRETFYAADGGAHVEPMTVRRGPVAAEFSKEGIVAAIRGAQSDSIRYPEFVQRALAAGVTGYWAFLTGKRVIYFGRKGEMHIEEFPAAK